MGFLKWLIGVLHDRYVYNREEKCNIPKGTMKWLVIYKCEGYPHKAVVYLRSRYGVSYWDSTLYFSKDEVKEVGE